MIAPEDHDADPAAFRSGSRVRQLAKLLRIRRRTRTRQGHQSRLPAWFGPVFYLILSSQAVVTLAIGVLAWGPLHVDDMVVSIVLGPGLVNLVGAWGFLRSLETPQGSTQGLTDMSRRLRLLPRWCALWAFSLIVVFLGGHHLRSHLGYDFASVIGFLYPMTLIVFYGLLMGLFQYLSVGSLVAAVRRLADHGECDAPTSLTRLSYRLAGVVTAAGFTPLALGLVHRRAMESMSPHHVPDVEMFLALDVAAAVLIIAASIVFFLQTVSRPVEDLLACMRQLQDGDFATRARAVTDDEIGALSTGFNVMAAELREQMFLHEALGRFVPDTVSAAVRADHGVILPKEADASILFSDIEGFTRLCQSLSPQEIISILNEYFGALGNCVRRHGGVITQFQGDAMLVTFNLPVPDPDHAMSAVRAALDIQDVVGSSRFGAGVMLPTRVGISTGPVVAGTVGDHARLGYTVHGETVNLAQRLEEANKHLGTRILVSERTARLLRCRIPARRLEPIEIRGIRGPVIAFAIPPGGPITLGPEACTAPGSDPPRIAQVNGHS